MNNNRKLLLKNIKYELKSDIQNIDYCSQGYFDTNKTRPLLEECTAFFLATG